MNHNLLPIKRELSPAYKLSLAVAVLMVMASLAGLLFSQALYQSEDLRQAFVPNDVINLLIGLPILLGSMALARRGSLMGLLFWPGALLYTLYNYIAYAVAMPLTV
jgi:4-hydroxybenzoate polyprenyltransferase